MLMMMWAADGSRYFPTWTKLAGPVVVACEVLVHTIRPRRRSTLRQCRGSLWGIVVCNHGSFEKTDVSGSATKYTIFHLYINYTNNTIFAWFHIMHNSKIP